MYYIRDDMLQDTNAQDNEDQEDQEEEEAMDIEKDSLSPTTSPVLKPVERMDLPADVDLETLQTIRVSLLTFFSRSLSLLPSSYNSPLFYFLLTIFSISLSSLTPKTKKGKERWISSFRNN